MTAPPLPRDTRRSPFWLMLLVAALFARATAPEGWMPTLNAAGGIEITICNGQMPGETMVLGTDGKIHKAPAKGQTGEHPCAFAGTGVANAAPPLPAIIAPVRAERAGPSLTRVALVPGRGLAAPPPPATGPPPFA